MRVTVKIETGNANVFVATYSHEASRTSDAPMFRFEDQSNDEGDDVICTANEFVDNFVYTVDAGEYGEELIEVLNAVARLHGGTR